jgi:hypothetical protein
MYFIVTNKDDIHFGESGYRPKIKTGFNSYWGFIIHNTYSVFQFLRIDDIYIRCVIIPSNAIVRSNKNNYVISNKIIVSDRHYIYSIKTLTYFNFDLRFQTSFLTNLICYNGRVDLLEWLKNSKCQFRYSEQGLLYASMNGHVNVLKWWKKNELPLTYSEELLKTAYMHDQFNVIEYFKEIWLIPKHVLEKYV